MASRLTARGYRNVVPPHCPSSHHSTRKINTVLTHPPPSFFAPYPATRPRSSLLIAAALPSDAFALDVSGARISRERTESRKEKGERRKEKGDVSL